MWSVNVVVLYDAINNSFWIRVDEPHASHYNVINPKIILCIVYFSWNILYGELFYSV